MDAVSVGALSPGNLLAARAVEFHIAGIFIRVPEKIFELRIVRAVPRDDFPMP